MRFARKHQSADTGIIVESLISRGDVEATSYAVLARVVDLVAKDVAAEILKHHKGTMVRRVMQNPDLLRACKLEALQEAEKLLHSRL